MSGWLPLALVAAAYLLGATPTSFWVGRLAYGVDLRRRGSGNLGATNTLRVLGPKAAVPVMVMDVLKGWLPVWLFPRIDGSELFGWALAYALAAVLGHVFSFWVRFRGGKGMATSAGAFLALAPLPALVAVGAWAVTVGITRIVSLGSLTAAVVLPVAVAMIPTPGGDAMIGFTVLLAAFVFWTHRTNLARLLRGEEHRFGQRRRAFEQSGAEAGSTRTAADATGDIGP